MEDITKIKIKPREMKSTMCEMKNTMTGLMVEQTSQKKTYKKPIIKKEKNF